jgi:HEAT repeat protein
MDPAKTARAKAPAAFAASLLLAAMAALLLPLPLLNAGDDPPPGEDVAKAIEGLRARYLEDRQAAYERLSAMGSAVEAGLVEVLKDDDFRVRVAAAQLLGEMKSEKAIPNLIALLTGEDPEVKAAVMNALARIGRKAVEAALDALKKDGKDVPPDIIRDITCMQVEILLDALLTPSGSFGYFKGQFNDLKAMGRPGMDVLAEIAGNPGYSFKLIKGEIGVNDFDTRQLIARQMACEGLGECGDQSDIPALKKALDDSTVSEAAAVAMYKLGDTSAIDGQKRELEDAIVAAAKDNPQEAAQLKITLANLYVRLRQDEKAEPLFVQAVETLGDSVGEISVYNLACVYATMGKKDESIRYLRKAVKLGYRDVSWMEMDGDLAPVREMPEYKQIIKEILEED